MGEAIIVLKVDSLEQMTTLGNTARTQGLAVNSIQDAGRTQVDPGTVTVLAIGPDYNSKIDQVTGELQTL
jgi:PTH2 family peptidyl-tRNA hydrolase